MSTLRIGYSGSRHGMTRPQIRGVYARMCWLGTVCDNDLGIDGIEGHHGDCTGGDAQFHVLAVALGWRTVAHPPLNDRWRAWCQADEIREPKDYLARDWDIAFETGELIATPKTPQPVSGSGTWATIGYAVQLARPVTLVHPGDGRAGTLGAPVAWREEAWR